MAAERGWTLAPGIAVRAAPGTPEAQAMDAVFGAFATFPPAHARALTSSAAAGALRIGLDGLALFAVQADELAPALEASLLGWVVRTRPGALPLHAAALGWRDGALLLIGDKGSGKSTLSALLGRDTDYLGDEVALVDHATLALAPLAKAATIKRGGFHLLPETRTWRDPIRGEVRYHLPVRASHAGRPVTALVWPRHVPGQPAGELERLAPDEIALGLVQSAFGGLGREPRTITTIAALAALPGYALSFGDTAGARAALETALGAP